MVVMRVFAKAEQKAILMAVLLANRQAGLKAVQMEHLKVAAKSTQRRKKTHTS